MVKQKIRNNTTDGNSVICYFGGCGDFDTIQLPYGHVREVNATIADAAHQFGITVIDGLQMIPHDMTYFADDLHPNKDGFGEYAENLVKIIG